MQYVFETYDFQQCLGHMISRRGIEANPEKIQVIINIRSPRMTKEIQSLAGRVAALNQFVSQATD